LTNVLLIHRNFPGQFKHLVAHLAADPSISLVGIGNASAPGLAGFGNLARYELARETAPQTHAYVQHLESGVLHGQAVARVLLGLQERGWKADVVLAHIGWGEALYVKDVWPQARLVLLTEFYRSGAEIAETGASFDPEFPSTIDDRMRRRTRTSHLLLGLESADLGIAATEWQRSVFPPRYQSKIVVNHEGVDVDALQPDPQAELELADGTRLRAGQKIVTYVSRNLEPTRGFHVFMRAAEKLLQRVPDCRIVVVGGDGVSYGPAPADAANWREWMLRRVKIDPARVHFTGKLPYASYRKVLQVSAAHVYLTYPFVLSWSLLEAMAAGCLVVGSDTAPVREVIEHGRNGLMVDFFDVDGLVERLATVLADPSAHAGLRSAARETVLREYAVGDSLRRYRDLITEVLARPPSPQTWSV